MTTINIMQKAIKMSNITFKLHSKSTEPDNKECTAEYAVGDKKISVDFGDSQHAFNVDTLLNLAYEAGRKRGISEATQLMQTAINNIY